MPENAAEVTAAGIARLAGVGRAAVSNWRRRHPDFPQPVGGTDASPSFSLPEVEKWLRDQGKLAEVPLRERVWQQVASHPGGTADALRLAGAVLLLAAEHPEEWRALSREPDRTLPTRLAEAAAEVFTQRFGGPPPATAVPSPAAPGAAAHGAAAPAAAALAPEAPGPAALAAAVPLVRAAGRLAAELGPRQAYEFLLGRHLDTNPRQYTLTPPGLAELMAALALPGTARPGAPPVQAFTVLDPACGTGALLRAAGDCGTLLGQEADPALAALTAVRLALRTRAEVRVRAGDSLRADAFPGLAADAVLCHPPFNERNWGHDELTYDPRWEYGLPARTESELAWVQHALAHARPGGTVVVLMPPAAASRRSGRRVRADLLRRGALRAVVALPAGSAPPYGIPLHLWVLRRPDPAGAAGAVPPSPHLLLVDAAGLLPEGHGGHGGHGGREALPRQLLRDAVLEAWESFDRHGTTEARPGVARAVPVIELLDDDVDLAPARHLPPPAADDGPELTGLRERLAATLRHTAEITPAPGVPVSGAPAPGTPVSGAPGARRPTTTVGELARAGALLMRSGGPGAVPGGDGPAVLTEHDVVAGTGPTGTLPAGAPEDPVLTEEGDVVVPVLGRGAVARVVDRATAGAALGRNLWLLRPDPAVLDPWFLAGFLRGTANTRRASSYASTTGRLDVRRLQVPRMPLSDQLRYGARFRELAGFESALREAVALGEQLVRGLHDGLTDGRLSP
ncbi:N-6 DNA methylase [Streptomyces sp. HB2AG]|uniref:N-6 DNA methylase n=1 Tax=Streptomyces sp. HB2AG TaxID=2983400 RepID=UPI0022A9F812|nr:N-6 DNA methylase [Streptomyces sp. HB2AG]MCZ2528015.1 N-6 DNA methylase [Streptomyces sp. HB2AG]